MFITKDWLKENKACNAGTEWFKWHFPKGAEHAKVFDKLASQECVSYTRWLLSALTEHNTP